MPQTTNRSASGGPLTVAFEPAVPTPRLEGLSVKLRGDAMLEVKLQKGSAGLFEVPGLATGRISSWHKWSFPIGSQGQHVSDSSDWRRVRKDRSISWFSPSGQAIPAPDRGADEPSGCIVELTDITVGAEAWWTLGFEATGSDAGRRGAIQATAAVVLSEAEGVELRVDDSLPYSTWLTHQ
jgi:hypothetical protein